MAKSMIALKTMWVALVVAIGMMPIAASAQVLKDPTRPPASHGASGNDGATGAAPVSVPVLQSVLISPGRMVAIISGQTVKLGDQIGDARVIKITETEVVLRNGKDLQTLKLFPNIEKKASNGRSDSKPDNRTQ